MNVVAQDKDLPGSINAEIAYTIVSQTPKGKEMMFEIERKTGKLFVKEPSLDREV